MRFHCAVSEHESTERAVEQVIGEVRDVLADRIDAVFAFFSSAHCPQAQGMLEHLWLRLDPQAIVGCSAEGVIGADREIERAPGLAILAGQLPGIRLHPFHIPKSDWKEVLSDSDELAARLGRTGETRAVIGFGDPFSTPVNQFLPALDEACRGAPLIGGMASAARSPGENILLHNEQTYDEGFVGLSLAGPIDVQTVVSQGCREIGKPLLITKAQQNVIFELGGKPALGVLRDTISALGADEQQLLANGLLVGRAISEYREQFSRSDFLIRNIVGANEEAGAIAAGDHVRVGQTVQFFARDARTADEDLKMMLASQAGSVPAAGGLLFSCNGRGTRLFESAGHDISVARQAMPATPLAGFFAAGELGPVGGKNSIHGQTASFALLRPRKD